MNPAPRHDEKWIRNATLSELRQAIREEPPESDLFRGELGQLFWAAYRERTEEVYGGSVFGG